MSTTLPPLTTETCAAIDRVKRALQHQAEAEHEAKRARRESEAVQAAHDALALERVREYCTVTTFKEEDELRDELDLLRKQVKSVHRRLDAVELFRSHAGLLLCYKEGQHDQETPATNTECLRCRISLKESPESAFKRANMEPVYEQFHFFDACVRDFEPMPAIPE